MERLAINSRQLAERTKILRRLARGSVGAVIVCSLVTACAEADFVLAKDSRLPICFSVPAGLSRSDVTITLTFYEPPSGRTAVIKMFSKNGQLLLEVKGIVRRPRRDAPRARA